MDENLLSLVYGAEEELRTFYLNRCNIIQKEIIFHYLMDMYKNI